MAGGAFGDAETGKRAHLYEHKITGYFIFASIVAALGGSLFGYDLGVSGGVTSMDDFLIKFFPDVYRKKHKKLEETDYCKYDNQVLTLFTSSLYFAALLSTFGASRVTRNKGRRASILVGAVSFFIGGIVNAFAMNIAMLIIGRIFLGIGIGFGNQVTQFFTVSAKIWCFRSPISILWVRASSKETRSLTLTLLGGKILITAPVTVKKDVYSPSSWRWDSLVVGVAL